MTSKTPAPSDVAIITVSYNSSAQLADFLASAVKSIASPSQIFVVDNNSADIDVTANLTKKLGVNLLKLDMNVGYGSAVNKAIPVLPAEFTTLLVCNPDSELNPVAVTSLRSAVQDNKVGVAGPRIYNEDGSVYPSARSIPSIRNGVGHALFANIWLTNPWTKNYLSEAHLQNKTVATGWVSGACLAVRRDLFTQVGGFDDHYFMYFEDVDLGYRIGKLGYTNLYIPQASITHIGGESTKSVKTEMLKIHHDSAKHFLSVKYPGFLWFPVRAVLGLGLSIRSKLESLRNKA
ncbi:N-acetylglucosaminyl-diphospho-decaprenol L-rhamnosyltransferase [Aurantimicrobium minutum]|uniref:glycosyltransferase family 2 protein n=1 Tax=Aurantimicrobium minutum TaxID=708131 RepID=UPI002474326A|nr:glycosyltransferase family 2 protein [Aurantimicrobium minutum]MDH6409532.1 N-acetylglucosaminyl-diphospho-decaprenol L-rhamnosyltransferase [Aurantimicrobium minutum]